MTPARRIRGSDGRDKIQLRLDLGVLQMETTGRPDGQRPNGAESLLDYYGKQLARYKRRFGTEEGFGLDEQACQLLRAEGVMYYHRYVAEFILEDFEAVERDSLRNLRLFDFCKRYAREESDRRQMEQFRPYALMMITRARAQIALGADHHREALRIVRSGVRHIEEFYRGLGQEAMGDGSAEIAILAAMTREIESRIPVDPIQQLRRDLAKAVQEERYEDAAAIRDRLRQATGE